MQGSDQVPIKIDVKVNSKDATDVFKKLVDTIKAPFSFCAKQLEPILQAKAEVTAKMIRAKSIKPLAEELGISCEDAVSLVLRAEEREIHEQSRQQKCIETIISDAQNYIPEVISSEPVDEDWTINFIDSCKNINDIQMQTIWSKILAAELEKPGSFNKRAISFVKDLSKDEAYLFTEFCNHAWAEEGGDMFYIRSNFNNSIDIPLKFETVTELVSMGLVNFDMRLATENIDSKSMIINYFGNKYKINPDKSGKVILPIIPLTKLGICLYKICGAMPVSNYSSLVIKNIEMFGYKVDQLTSN